MACQECCAACSSGCLIPSPSTWLLLLGACTDSSSRTCRLGLRSAYPARCELGQPSGLAIVVSPAPDAVLEMQCALLRPCADNLRHPEAFPRNLTVETQQARAQYDCQRQLLRMQGLSFVQDALVFLTDRLNSGAVEHSSGAGGLMVRSHCLLASMIIPAAAAQMVALSVESTNLDIPATTYKHTFFTPDEPSPRVTPCAPSLVQVNGQVALGLEVLATLLRVLEEQSQLLPPEAVGRLKQLQAQARLRGILCSLHPSFTSRLHLLS